MANDYTKGVTRWLIKIILEHVGFRWHGEIIEPVDVFGHHPKGNDQRYWYFTVRMSNGYKYRIHVHQDHGAKEV